MYRYSSVLEPAPKEDNLMTRPSREPFSPGRPATPRWVKALAFAAVVIVAMIVVAMLVFGGEHGPGRHTGWTDLGPSTSPVIRTG